MIEPREYSRSSCVHTMKCSARSLYSVAVGIAVCGSSCWRSYLPPWLSGDSGNELSSLQVCETSDMGLSGRTWLDTPVTEQLEDVVTQAHYRPCSKLSRINTRCAHASSPASSPSRSRMPWSASRSSPMLSSTASCTVPTTSISKENRCATHTGTHR